MALIKCPECGKEISGKASQSIEHINKNLRLQTIFGMILFLIGLIILIREIIKAHHGIFFIFGIALMAVGLVWGVVVRIRTWWNKRKVGRGAHP